MGLFNQALVEGAHVVARAVELTIRQDPGSPNGTTTDPTTTTSPSPSSTDSASPSPSSGGDGGTGTSSPLLFFVALGFGVVFTNLWIIVGVKYCFRYNARNRAMRGLDENGEPINMEAMPARPHRRRREKKLMTMEEVNDKFPMVKYKTWVLERAREGLPTAGGVSLPPSRANSVRSATGIMPAEVAKERASTDGRPDTNTTEAAKPKEEHAEVAGKTETGTGQDGARRSLDNRSTHTTTSRRDSEDARGDAENAAGTKSNDDTNNRSNDASLTHAQTDATLVTVAKDRRESEDDEDDEDEDEQIDAALPPELMGTAGDTCAICIDTLEDDDDVRGLTCGHAFHAVCLDPWLTNRRACCPLCKTDYYIPKPRQQNADADPNNPNNANGDQNRSRSHRRINTPRAPPRSLNPWSREGRRILFGGGRTGSANPPPQSHQSRSRGQSRRHDHRHRVRPQPEPPATTSTEESQGGIAGFRSRLPSFRMPGFMQRNAQPQQPVESAEMSGAGGSPSATQAATNAATPSQLEAGVRPANT